MADLKITNEQLQQKIIEKRNAEEELHRTHLLLNAINDAQSHFIADSEEWILFDGLLKNLLLLTKSEYGFIGEILYNPQGEPYLKTHAITNITWNYETREFYKKNASSGMEFYNIKTLFGQVMITGKHVIANNLTMDERRGGLPPDHPPLISFMGVPFYQGKKLVGMAGIANCPAGYKEDLVKYLKPLLTTCANIIEAYRNENQRKRVEEELVHRARLAELGNEIGVALSQEDPLQNILQRCTESIVKNLDAAFARIWTFNQKDRVLELQASAGIYTHINGGHSRIPIGMYKIGRIAKDRKPHLTNRVIGDPEVNDQEWAHQENMVSFAGYPLIIEDKLVGVMAMFSRQPLMDFSLKALSSVADNIANGIERKQGDEKMKQSEEKYRDLFQNANDAICILDSDLKYMDVNNKMVEMLGYTREELLNMSVHDLIPSEQIPISEIEFNTLRKKGSYEKFVGKARTKDGFLIDVEVSSSVINEGDKIIGSRDIIHWSSVKTTILP
jgi:PAS domain S-box-containing protein